MNKILESPLRAEIDKLLLAGSSVYEVETWCRNNGLSVSATSIKRYAEQHLPDWQGNKPVVKESVVSNEAKDENKTNKSYKTNLTDTEISDQFNQIIIDNLKEPFVNMVTLFNLKIGQYCNGEGNLPKDDIAMLEKIVGLFDSITAKHNENRAGKNIFDIDSALSQPKKIFEEQVDDLKTYLENISLHEENAKLKKQLEELNYE